MLIHPQIDPIAIAIGPLAVRWYGLMYLVGFGAAFLLARSRIKRGMSGSVSYAVFDDLFFFSVLGVVLG
ncbi:MAG: prolipoprotein diacylglyceryl transferase family protein, partial [Giesbergeria sp.]